MHTDPLQAAEELLRRGDPRGAMASLEGHSGGAKGAVLRAEAMALLGSWARARDHASEALSFNVGQVRVAALVLIAAGEAREGRLGAARKRLADARQAALGDVDKPLHAALVFAQTARIEVQLGRGTEADAAIERAELACRLADAPQLIGRLWLLRATTRLDRGDVEGAKLSLQEAQALFRRLEHRGGQGWAHLGQARWLLRRGKLGHADDHASNAVRRFRELGNPLGEGFALDLRGEVARARGHRADAARTYGKAIAVLRQTDDPALEPRLHLALTLLDQGRSQDARDAFEPVLADAERLKRRRLLPTLHACLLATAAAAGDHEHFVHHLREANDLLDETGSATADAARGAHAAGTAAGQRRDVASLSRAVRAHGLALRIWHHLRDDQAAVEEARTLRRLAERDAPIPCGDWDLVELIGYGAMGEVWRARHHHRHTEAAVKLMLRGEAGNRRLAALIAAEVRAVAGLHHPHVVEVLDHGHLSPTTEVLTSGRQRAQTPWFAVTLARAGTLEPRCGHLNWDDCRRILLALLDALAHAHARGVIHLDLKPGNVLLDPREDGEQVLLTDFGLAGALAAFTGSTGLLGTPYTMSPEQFDQDRSRFGPWTDLYALGCLGYHLVQGRPPFPGRGVERLRKAHQTQAPPPLQARVAVPGGLEGWLHRLMAKDPADRFQCAADAAFALDALGPADVPPVADHTEPPPANLSFSTLSLAHVGDTSRPSFSHPSGPPVPSDWHMPRQGTIASRAGASLELFRVRHPPMVGQQEARDIAWGALADATRRQLPVLLRVQGPPGSGRSRLLRWLAELAHERGAAQVVPVQADDDLWPEVIAAVVEARPHQLLEESSEAIAQVAPELADPTVQVLARAAANLPSAPQPVAGAVAQALRLRSRSRPLLLSLDGPWLDRPEGIALIQAVAALTSPVVVAVEATAGREMPQTEATEVAATLTTTTDSDLATIIDDLLPLEPHLTSTIVRRAAGNPQLAIELLTDLVDRQLLLWRRGRYGLRDGVVLELPEATREVWRQRLERALVGVATMERAAAVLGALLGSPVSMDQWNEAARRMGLSAHHEVLDRLQSAWLVQVEGTSWRFLHPVLERVTESLADVDGTLAGACLAAAYVLGEAEPPGPPGRIGRLLNRGGAHDAALEPLALGIHRALLRGDLEEVADLLDRRAHALQHLGVSSQDGRWLADALGRGGLALERGDVGMARREAERGVLLAGDGPGRANAHLLLARAMQRQGETARARHAYSVALASADDEAGLMGQILYGLGELLRSQGALEAAEVHLQMAEEHVRDDPGTQTAILLAQARVALARGQLDAAEQRALEADELGQSLSLRRVQVAALCLHGDVRRWKGDLDDADRRYQRALALCAGHEADLAARVAVQRALAHLAAGDDSQARRHLDRASAGAPRVLHDLLKIVRLPLQANAPDRTFDQALDQARRALDRSAEDPDYAFCLEAAARRAESQGRQRLLWAMAAEVWRSLGRPRQATRAERELSALARR